MKLSLVSKLVSKKGSSLRAFQHRPPWWHLVVKSRKSSSDLQLELLFIWLINNFDKNKSFPCLNVSWCGFFACDLLTFQDKRIIHFFLKNKAKRQHHHQNTPEIKPLIYFLTNHWIGYKGSDVLIEASDVIHHVTLVRSSLTACLWSTVFIYLFWLVLQLQIDHHYPEFLLSLSGTFLHIWARLLYKWWQWWLKASRWQ